MTIEIVKLISLWNRQEAIAKLLEQLVLYQFVQLNPLKSLNLSFPPRLILYKYQNPIIGDDSITLGEEQALAIGKMYSLTSLTRGFGYLFEFPNIKYFHGPGYFGVNRRMNPENSKSEVRLKGQYLNVFESETGVLCIGKIPPTYVERYGFKQHNV